MSAATVTRVCECGCNASLEGKREGARYATGACRVRAHRRGSSPDGYVVTDEDRAAMRRVAELVPVPVPELTPEHHQQRAAELRARAAQQARRLARALSVAVQRPGDA